MSTIISQPDQLSFSGNMQKFVISSTVDVIFELKKPTPEGLITILSQVYKPGTDSLVTISIGGIIEQLLEVMVPGNLISRIFKRWPPEISLPGLIISQFRFVSSK